MTPTGGDTIDPCSVCGAESDPRHIAALWDYCTACGEAFDREYETDCLAEDKKGPIS